MLIKHELDLRSVAAFVAVVERGGFSAAALALHITQPALSRRISELEATLGSRLFDRTSRRVQLTSVGELLLARSRNLLADAHALRERAQALKSGNSGVLSLGGTPFILENLVLPFLVRYRKRRPDVEIQLHEQGGAQLLERVLSGDLHMAVATAVESRLASRPLFPWCGLAVTASTHPLAGRPKIEIEALADEPLLVLPPEFIMRRIFDAACETTNFLPRIRMQSATPQTLVAMARAEYGVAIVPSVFLMDKRAVKVLPILVRGKLLGRWTAINWDERRYQPAYVKQFTDELAEFAAEKYPGQTYKVGRAIARPESRGTKVSNTQV
jgi:LysR family transcriptional regulator, cyn operon transcriptional activator